MAKNTIQFQKGLGLHEFLEIYSIAVYRLHWSDTLGMWAQEPQDISVPQMPPSDLSHRRHHFPWYEVAFEEMVSGHLSADSA